MKKVIFLFLIFVLIFEFDTYASIGPSYTQGQPYTNLFVINENSPIAVKNEDLTIDLSWEYSDSIHRDSNTTSIYNMVNTSNTEQSVRMAFACVDESSAVSKTTKIIENGKDIPYHIYLGNIHWEYSYPSRGHSEAKYNYSAMNDEIIKGEYMPKNFSLEDIGTLYTIRSEQTIDEMALAVRLDYDSSKAKVYTTGFNQPQYASKSVQVANGNDKIKEVTLFILGEKKPFMVEGYKDYTLENKTDAFTYNVAEETLSLKSYLTSMGLDPEDTPELQNMNIKMRMQALDESFTEYNGYSCDFELESYENIPREMLLYFDVVFPPNGTKKITITHDNSISMDRRNVANERKPIFTNKFLFDVPDNWNSFENLNITVIPSENARYMVKSNIAFTKDQHGVYHSSLAEMPKKDLVISMHADEVVIKKNFFAYPRNIIICFILYFIVGFKLIKYSTRKELL